MGSPGVHLKFPSTFGLWPDSLPRALPPPVKERSFRAPFGIDYDLYNFALRPEIPFTFAALYVATVFALNAYNRSKKHEAWWISKQTWFKYFIVVHNTVLALYSFATFLAMFRAIVHTLPAWNADNWAPRVADGLCKLHGPRGLGDAATFNTTINIWEVKNSVIKLGYTGNPDPTDVGRLWNEGLAFWGWLFYVSKFYEVLDTMIIIVKGKRSATLQTYHHAGAMLCMWAGIRYMSPPIWMFVFINSAIHAMMYTYFSLSALGYKVPNSLKRTLTSLQIAQFVFGASYAAAHLFVQYDVPMQIPYTVTSVIERAASSASSAASAASRSATSAVSAVSSFAESPAAIPTWGALVKKLLLRAAGEDGVAERVGLEEKFRDVMSNPLGAARAGVAGLPNAEDHVQDKVEKWFEKRYETRYRSEWTKVDCIDTSGEAFAIYLNLLYLAPLTFLFGRFFIRAYTQRGKRRTLSDNARKASESAKDASNQTEYEIERSGERVERELENRGPEVADQAGNRLEELRKDVKALKDGTFRDRKVSDRVQSYEEKVKEAAEKAKEKADKALNGSRRSSPSKKGSTEGMDEDAVEDGSEESQRARSGSNNKESSTAQPEEEQDAAMAESQATRPGTDESSAKSSNDKSPAEKSAQQSKSKGFEQAKQKGDQQAKSKGSKPASSKPEGQSKPGKSDSNAPASNDDDDDTYADVAARPASSDDSKDADTDAMGASGSIIDLASETAKEASEKAEKTGGPFKPPGAANGT